MNTDFHSAMIPHTISLQSGAIESSNEMIMMGDYYNSSATTSTRFLGNSSLGNSNSGFTQSGNSSGSVLGDSVPGLAVEWSAEERHKLEEGLLKFGDEPSIRRYIKIAATLRDKTVRDVALRCRWMARKRRKNDEQHMGKKLKDNKDNLAKSSSKPSISSAPTFDVAPFTYNMNTRVQIDALSGSIRHLIEQNNQVLGQISANIASIKLQDNIDLFSYTKYNIIAILNDLGYMPGPPLPISLNEDLVHSILQTTSQRMMFETSKGMYLKQEPGLCGNLY